MSKAESFVGIVEKGNIVLTARQYSICAELPFIANPISAPF
jgi:hypothetical protein